jgi:hypothetical protein
MIKILRYAAELFWPPKAEPSWRDKPGLIFEAALEELQLMSADDIRSALHDYVRLLREWGRQNRSSGNHFKHGIGTEQMNIATVLYDIANGKQVIFFGEEPKSG